jgi:hypothetical protein
VGHSRRHVDLAHSRAQAAQSVGPLADAAAQRSPGARFRSDVQLVTRVIGPLAFEAAHVDLALARLVGRRIGPASWPHWMPDAGPRDTPKRAHHPRQHGTSAARRLLYALKKTTLPK